MFYTYRQNNSGGYFIKDAKRGIGNFVIIEADNPEDADNKAEDIGLYFNGVDDGPDCPCCGDRWDRASDWDQSEVPLIYEGSIKSFLSKYPDNSVFIHCKDGAVFSYGK